MATAFNFIKAHACICKDSKRPFPHLLVHAAVVGWEGDNKLQVWTNNKNNFSSSQLSWFFISLLMCFYFLATTPSFIHTNSFQNYKIHMFKPCGTYDPFWLISRLNAAFIHVSYKKGLWFVYVTRQIWSHFNFELT